MLNIRIFTKGKKSGTLCASTSSQPIPGYQPTILPFFKPVGNFHSSMQQNALRIVQINNKDVLCFPYRKEATKLNIERKGKYSYSK